MSYAELTPDALPNGWDVKRLKEISKVRAGVPAPSDTVEEGAPFLRVSDLSKALKGYCSETRDKLSPSESEKTAVFPINTIVLPKSGESIRTNARARLSVPMHVVSHLACFNERPNVTNGMLYWILVNTSFESVIDQTALPALGLQAINNFKVAVPPPAEQQAIADYLDLHTSIIDNKVELLKKKVVLLKEYRKAVIHEAVTKGLDKSAKLVESGVEWIGMIPEGWSVIRAEKVLGIVKEEVGDLHHNLELLSLTTKGVIFRDKNSGFGKFPAEFNSYQHIESGDFIFCLFDVEETPRTVGVARQNGMITGAYTRMKCNIKRAVPSFLEYLYISIDSFKLFRPKYTGMRNTVKKDTFLKHEIPLPPRKEQQAIADYLDAKTSAIDAQISIVEKLIAANQELKKSLIHEVVTGKRRVKVN